MKQININNFKEKLYYEKLDNGLEVYLVPLNNKKKFFVSLGVKYGNCYTSFEVNNKKHNVPLGVAHFLEHKLFERNNSIDPFDFYAKSGTDVNAGTSIFYTQYYFSGNNDYLNNLHYLLNWIPNIYITDETVAKEKGIIIQEANMHQDNPDRLLDEKIRLNMFINDSFGQKVIGTTESINSITKDDLLLCYNSFYRPDNMFIIAVGDLNPDETIDAIKNELKDYKNPTDKIKKTFIEEPDKVAKEYDEIFMNVSNSRVGYNFKLNKKLFKFDNYKTQIYLSMILSLSFGNTSEFREQALKNNLFLALNTNFMSSLTHYIFGITAITDKKDELIVALKNYFKKLYITEESFDRIRKAWIANEIRSFDSINVISMDILTDLIEFDKYYNNKIDDLKSLKYNELQEVLKELVLDNLSVTVIGPKK